MAVLAVGFPPPPGGVDGGRVAAVEQFEAALIVADVRGSRAVGEEQELGPVGVIIRGRQPYRLVLGRAVLFGAVGQPRALFIGPQKPRQRLDALLRAGQNQGPLAGPEGLFQELRQHLL